MLTAEQVAALRRRFPSSTSKPICITARKARSATPLKAAWKAISRVGALPKLPGTIGSKFTNPCARSSLASSTLDPHEIAMLTSASAGINAIASALQFFEPPQSRHGRIRVPYHGTDLARSTVRAEHRLNSSQALITPCPSRPTSCSIDNHTAIVPSHASLLPQRRPRRFCRHHNNRPQSAAPWSLWMAIKIAALAPSSESDGH